MKKVLLLLFLCFVQSIYAVDYVWGPSERISDSGGESDGPQIGLDAQGNAVSVWRFFDGMMQLVIQASTKLSGQPWTPNPGMTISDPMEQVDDPQLAVDPAGNAIAIWGTGTNILRFAVKPFGGAWTMPGQVTPNQTAERELVVDSAGNAFAIWQQMGGIFVSDLPFMSGVWSAPTNLDMDASAAFPSIGVDANGNPLAIWIANMGTEVRFARRVGMLWVGGTVETYPGLLGFPSLCVDSSGHAVGVWSSDSGIRAATFDGTSWSSVFPIPNSGMSNDAIPDVACDPQGNAVAIWENNGMIQTAFKPFNQPWSSITNLGPGNRTPQVAMDACGTAVAIWENGPMILTASKAPRFGWSSPFTLSSTAAVFAADPQIAVGPCGHAIAVWDDTQGMPSNVQTAEAFIPSPALFGLKGKQVKNDFATVREYFNFLRWQPNPSAVSFNVYRNGDLIVTLDGDTDKYKDRNRKKGKRETYDVTSIDANGNESSSIFITVP